MNTTKHCAGCRDNFYNGRQNVTGDKCWNLESAELVKRLLIPVDLRPPYLHLKQKTVPNCYHRERHVTVKPEALTDKGYWR